MEDFRTGFDPRDLAVVGDIASAALVTLPGITGDNRVGRPGLNLANATSNVYAYTSLPNLATVGQHVAFYATSLTGVTPTIMLTDSSSNQLVLRVSSSGMLTLYAGNGSTVLATSGANLITTNRWYSIEWQATISSTIGAVTVQVNTVPWITVTGINTQTTANAYVNGFTLSGSWYATDVVVWDTTGASNNTFYGDCRVDWIAPSGGAPNLGGFSPYTGGPSDPSGVLYQAPTTGATVLVPASTPPAITGTVMSVTVNLQARKTDNSLDIDVAALISLYSHRPAPPGAISYPVYHGSSVSPSLGTNATWQYYAACFPLAPALVTGFGTGSPVPWTLSDLGIMSFGAETV